MAGCCIPAISGFEQQAVDGSSGIGVFEHANQYLRTTVEIAASFEVRRGMDFVTRRRQHRSRRHRACLQKLERVKGRRWQRPPDHKGAVCLENPGLDASSSSLRSRSVSFEGILWRKF